MNLPVPICISVPILDLENSLWSLTWAAMSIPEALNSFSLPTLYFSAVLCTLVREATCLILTLLGIWLLICVFCSLVLDSLDSWKLESASLSCMLPGFTVILSATCYLARGNV